VFHERIVKNFTIALTVFMSADVQEARRLISEKVELRSAELAAAERHLERLRAGKPESWETTSLHLDVLRDLKRIHSHICSVAYPVLDAGPRCRQGEPSDSRAECDADPRAAQAKS
jgi:phosphate:Na+ symporter